MLKRLSLLCSVFLLPLGISGQSSAGTIVRVSTTMGDYSIELLDDVAPLTVQNFLNYVAKDDYNGTYLHRVVDSFVVQGGGYGFELFVGPIEIVADPPVPNEFNVSNTRGTVAMAKLDGDPDSATNQWFVSLADNSANLDNSNGGFTVFGNVLGDGMVILDAIDSLPTVELGTNTPLAPFFTALYTNPLDLVYLNVEVVERFSGAPNVYEVNSGLLIASVSLDGGASIISVNFSTVSTAGEVVLQANPSSVIPRRDTVDGIATFSNGDNRLRIPTLEVNDRGTVSLVTDVVLVLTDPERLQFTLESFTQ
ncbi:MAG: peptidyl-prolyl cis-trans isomerase A (cyclophilin A) [Pseudohongiellaceae bacterium]|jgi:peptidyl-prolyl cis-trans isomerase A (cyclophilin A)